MATKKEKDTAIAKLDELYQTKGVIALSELPAVERAVATARALAEFQKHVDVILDDVMPLAGSGIGFQMDKRYTKAQVRDAFTESLMLGLEPTNRQWAIISERLYIQKEGLRHIFRRYPNLTDMEVQVDQNIELKSTRGNKWVAGHFPVSITYRLAGQPQKFETTVYCTAYNNDTAMDAMRGKAERKGMMKLFEKLTGSAVGMIDTDDVEPLDAGEVTVEAEVKPDDLSEASFTLADELLVQLDEAATKEDLIKVSELISTHKEANDLAPSDLKNLGQAYTDSLKRIESGQAV